VESQQTLGTSSVSSHNTVLKPGFQNRRLKSEYQKGSYPAGFRMRTSRQLAYNRGDAVLSDAQRIATSRNNVGPTFSFHDWAKGEEEETAGKNEEAGGDPWADVAGPDLRDIIRYGRKPEVQTEMLGALTSTPQFQGGQSQVVAHEMPIHFRESKGRRNHQYSSVSLNSISKTDGQA